MSLKKNHKARLLTLIVALLLVGFGYNYADASGKGHGKSHWGYSGEEGPENWGHLSDKFSACSQGREQSPIDISGAKKGNLEKIKFHYKNSDLKILNNGHTVQVNYAGGSYIEVGGVRYDLLQFHFHTPSEHNVNGKSYDMEMHLVHKSKAGGLAVVGVLVNKGKKNKAFKAVFNNLPEHAGAEQSVKATVKAKKLLPKDRSYYAYNGSLTTPPCSEGVKWHVLTTAIEMSAAQIEAIGSIMHHNNRPLQPVNDRTVTH